MLRQTPFVPFRLIISGGDSYDVMSPESMVLTNTFCAVVVPGQVRDDDIIALLRNDSIADITPIPG